MEETLRLDYVPVTQQYDVTIRSHQIWTFADIFYMLNVLFIP